MSGDAKVEGEAAEDPGRVRLLARATRLTGWFAYLAAVGYALWAVTGGGESGGRGGLFPAVIFTLLFGLPAALVLLIVGVAYGVVARGIKESGRRSEGLATAGFISLCLAGLMVAVMHAPMWDHDAFVGWAWLAAALVLVFGLHGAIVGAYDRRAANPRHEVAWWLVVAAAVVFGEVRIFSVPPLGRPVRPLYETVVTPVKPAAAQSDR